MLEKEYKYFESIADEMAITNPHKFAVIKGEAVIGVYDTIKEALEATAKQHALGTFIIQRCEDRQHRMQRFHSRVAFA